MWTLGFNDPSLSPQSMCHWVDGCIKVSGQNMHESCLLPWFHDSKWAVFMISASFTTLALPGVIQGEDVELDYSQARRLCQQVCTLRLGNKGVAFKELATIYCVSAGRSGVLPLDS